MTQINRKHKDRLFRLIFADEKNKANTLSLYNALNDSSYQNAEDLDITTIEDVIYIKMKNDLSFIIDNIMNLYEQQSSHNPNMPLRGFLYFGNLYEKHLVKEHLDLHSSSLVKIPTPRYVVFYNGTKKRPASEKLKLSDAFYVPDCSGEFEWTCTVINLNHPDNKDLLTRCKPLYDYTILISKIQTYQKSMPVVDAVEKATDECIAENIMAEFLKLHKTEVAHMYLAEVDEQLIMANSYSDGFQEGRAEGHTELLFQLIARKCAKGKTLEQIAEELEDDVETIRPIYDKLVKTEK